MQTPVIIDKPALIFVGLETSFIHIRSPDANGHRVIGPLWEQFLERRDEIPHAQQETAFGIIYGRDESQRGHPHDLQYIAGLQVTQVADELPSEMVANRAAGTVYATISDGSSSAT